MFYKGPNTKRVKAKIVACNGRVKLKLSTKVIE